MAEVICIRANEEEERTVRVAAYCRVSSLPQEESYSSQVRHFESFIGDNPNWKLVKVYGDEGVTGLNTRKRDGFKRMLSDGKKKKFDLLLVKSISRLGRNTVDLLQCVRDLRAVGVSVFFEKENLSTDESAGELMITLLSAFAQMESESISANVRIGLNYKMQRGEWSVAYSHFLGYDRTPEGEVVINLKQAETVRFIFDSFLEGNSLGWIVRKLIDQKRPTGAGSLAWNKTSVQRILQNRKYSGDVVLQITVTEDVLTKHRIMNNGIAPQYVVVDGIPPIISRQTWFLVQGELERRGHFFHYKDKGFAGPDVSRYKNGFTGKLVCKCGANYNRVNANGKYVWKCYNRIHGSCNSEIVSEKELEAVILTAAQSLWKKKVEIHFLKIPLLGEDDDRRKMMDAAACYMENVFAGRIKDFMEGEYPVKYDIGQLDLVERIDFDGRFNVKFYTGIEIIVDRINVVDEVVHMTNNIGKVSEDITFFNVTGEPRKRLVQRLATLTGYRPVYRGFPSLAYEVGNYVVTRDGTVEGRLSKKVLSGLARAGFVAVDVS